MEHETRKRINILLNDTERKTVEEKAHQYGYSSMAAYIRDAAIYEEVTVYDLEGKTEVGVEISNLSQHISDYSSDLKMLLLRKDLGPADAQAIKEQNKKILFALQNLEHLVEEKLWSVERIKKVIGEGRLF